jgi:hypothetical protein
MRKATKMVKKISLVLGTLFALALAACGPGVPGELTPVVSTAVSAGTVLPETFAAVTLGPAPTEPPATPIPSLPSALSPTELKYRLLEEYPDFFYCDPDFYPVARADEGELARERFPELQANPEEFQAILAHNGLGGQSTFTDEQKLLVYREHKKLAAIQFELAGDAYRFQLRTADTNTLEGFFVTGTIAGQGRIEVQESTPGFVDCPICLAAGTRIDTPRGPVAVEDLLAGDVVWTLNRAGERVSAAVLKVAQAPVPVEHRMAHLILDDGREVLVSPGHPTADGRRVGDLGTGDLLDGARLVSLEVVPYDHSATYDLLPSGDTGLYWADGILLDSSLDP